MGVNSFLISANVTIFSKSIDNQQLLLAHEKLNEFNLLSCQKKHPQLCHVSHNLPWPLETKLLSTSVSFSHSYHRNCCCKSVLKMAPNGKKALSAAERQRKRREKLKNEGRYVEYKARHAEYQNKYRERKNSQMKNQTPEEQAEAVLLRREQDRLRKRRNRAKATTPDVPGQNHRAYSRLSSLHRAVNLNLNLNKRVIARLS